LQDGSLPEQLNNVLDSRGDPRVPFQLYTIAAEEGGIYIVVEVFGRRRPHMSNDGRYYLRRNLMVRRMNEAEVAEAYRERLTRERLALEPDAPTGAALADEVDSRIHHGLTSGELAMYREETGRAGPPGWYSVVAHPVPLRANLLDPTRFNPWVFHEIEMN